MEISIERPKDLKCCTCESNISKVQYNNEEPFETWTCPKCGIYSVVIEGKHTES